MAHDVELFVKSIRDMESKLERAFFATKLEAANLLHRQLVVNIDNLLRKHPMPTGRLRNSIDIKAYGDEVSVTVGNDAVPYANLQEYGGEVTPRLQQWLTIPVSRRTYRKPARHFGKLTFIPVDSERALLKFRSGELAYILAKRVKIEGVGYAKKARDTMYQSQEVKNKLIGIMQRAVNN